MRPLAPLEQLRERGDPDSVRYEDVPTRLSPPAHWYINLARKVRLWGTRAMPAPSREVPGRGDVLMTRSMSSKLRNSGEHQLLVDIDARIGGSIPTSDPGN